MARAQQDHLLTLIMVIFFKSFFFPNKIVSDFVCRRRYRRRVTHNHHVRLEITDEIIFQIPFF